MKTKKYVSFFLIVFLFAAKTAFAQDSTYSSRMLKHHNMEMKKDTVESRIKQDTSIVKEGEIDLKAIDKNKDGKIFQDMMDWNVISDKAGECPLCGMNLKEVTLGKAKENLVKHNFKVKED